MTARKHRPQAGFFDIDSVYAQISEMGDKFEILNTAVDWELFRPTLNEIFDKPAKGAGGRPSYDRMFMFKVLILQEMYGLSDRQTQYDILNRMDFRRFLGLEFSDAVPDEKTIWHFRQQLVEAGAIMDLFEAFRTVLKEKGLILNKGMIVDATIVPSLIQHRTRQEKEALKAGKTPEEWDENPNMARQKDPDAAWTKKNSKSFFGYKNHVKVDEENKLIETFEVTPANVHDSQILGILIDEEDAGRELYGDAAYTGEPIRALLRENKIHRRLHLKGTAHNPLTESGKRLNRLRSRTRARVEHVFGNIRMRMRDIRIRGRGLLRAAFTLGLRNLIYNMGRSAYLLCTG